MLAAVCCALLLPLDLTAGLVREAAEDLPNLLVNNSFEDGKTGWEFTSWAKRSNLVVDNTEKHRGHPSVRLQNVGADDSFARQKVAVKPHTRYRLSGYIKTKDVEVKGAAGAALSLEGGFERTVSLVGDKEWTRVSFEFETGPLDTIKVGARLGHHGALAVGTAWFSELSLVEVGPAKTR
jgi:hypothetical protein